MPSETVTRVTGTAVPLLADDIDTDRIIPARFLRCVTFEGLGEHAFEDDRAQDPDHPFNQIQFAGAGVLVAGRNFGCGSSREHAPQALMRWGIGAIVAESYAEIFFGNCAALGIPAATLPRPDLDALAAAVHADPQLNVTVDLETSEIRHGENSVTLEIPESVRTALVSGSWDFLAS